MSDDEHSSAANAAGEPRVKASKAILFFVLSILWIFPSVGAGWIIGVDLDKLREARSIVAFFASVKLEQWLALLLLALHGVFIFLAIHFRGRILRRRVK